MRALVAGLLFTLACGSPGAADAPQAVTVPPQPPPSPEPPTAPPPTASGATEATPPPQAPQAARGKLTIERTIPAGKWPEGVVVIGDEAWVAESGSRRLVRLGLAKETKPVYAAVGRLPVDVGVANGKVYTVAQTDNQLWEIDPRTAKGRVVATTSDCPQAMTLEGGAAWILLWKKCASGGSSVVRVDLATGKQAASAETGRDAFALAHGAGQSWVTTGETVTAVPDQDPKAVRALTLPIRPGAIPGARRIAATADGVYTSAERQVLFYDPARGEVTASVELGDRILGLHADSEMVLAAGIGGTIWELEPKTLAPRKELAAATTLEPRSLARWGTRILVVDHGVTEGGGRLHVLAPTVP